MYQPSNSDLGELNFCEFRIGQCRSINIQTSESQCHLSVERDLILLLLVKLHFSDYHISNHYRWIHLRLTQCFYSSWK